MKSVFKHTLMHIWLVENDHEARAISLVRSCLTLKRSRKCLKRWTKPSFRNSLRALSAVSVDEVNPG